MRERSYLNNTLYLLLINRVLKAREKFLNHEPGASGLQTHLNTNEHNRDDERTERKRNVRTADNNEFALMITELQMIHRFHAVIFTDCRL